MCRKFDPLFLSENAHVTPLEIMSQLCRYGHHFLILNRIPLFVCWPSRAFLFLLDRSSLFVSASLSEPSFFPIGHVNNIPTVQFFTEISRNTLPESYRLGYQFTEFVWDFHNGALWDTHEHTLLALFMRLVNQKPLIQVLD